MPNSGAKRLNMYSAVTKTICNGEIKKKIEKSYYRPSGFQKFEATRFQENLHMKV
jgi:hypothetical protein